MSVLSELDLQRQEADGGDNPLPMDEAPDEPIGDSPDGLTEKQGEGTVGVNALKAAETAQEPSPAEVSQEDEKRAEHEAAEAKRKAEWEESQRKKREAEQAELDKIAAMGDEEVVADCAARLRNQTEKLTRRNMKILTTARLQALGRENAEFARLVMNPKKSMAHCFQYVSRKALDFVKQEMESKGEKLEGIFVEDVPDELCYQFAEEYFRDANAPEDTEPQNEFVPRPYYGGAGRKNKAKKPEKKAAPKTATPKKPENKEAGYGQLSLDSLQPDAGETAA